VISDPPNFAPRNSAREAALGAYRALHTGSAQLVEPGGLYLAASDGLAQSRARPRDKCRAGPHQPAPNRAMRFQPWVSP